MSVRFTDVAFDVLRSVAEDAGINPSDRLEAIEALLTAGEKLSAEHGEVLVKIATTKRLNDNSSRVRAAVLLLGLKGAQ
jgi:hypothetical protein